MFDLSFVDDYLRFLSITDFRFQTAQVGIIEFLWHHIKREFREKTLKVRLFVFERQLILYNLITPK